MAEKKDKSSVGFDPLAWMDDDSDAEKIGNKEQTQADVAFLEEPENADKEVLIESSKTNEPINEDTKIVLDATLNIQNVAVLYEKLKYKLDNENTIEIDASAVTTIDTASLQLLIVLKQTALKLHKEMIIDFPSDKFIEAAELLGLSEMLEVDQAAAGLF